MSQSLIFITGATGFIGSHVVSQTLEAGYHVRLSVRRESQINSLKKVFSEYTARLTFVVIPDLAEPGAFNEVLRGVEYVFHIASPMPGKGSDFKQDYLGPAKNGTIALLDAAKTTPTIKSVIIVSSLLALLPLDAILTGNFSGKEGSNPSILIDPDMEFPSDPWASAGLKYHASKVLAHRAVLEWVPKNEPNYSVITLHPSFVFGRNLTQTSADGIDGTNAMLWESFFSEKPSVPMAPVDVRDVALAHLRALNLDVNRQSNVQEFLLSAPEAGGWKWERVVEFVNEKYPDLKIQLKGPFGEIPKLEAKRATELLGIKWRNMEDTISSFLDHQLELKSQL
ncbi:NAD dependent epimerase/dehydratase [Colletotrichum tofieldiae]|uniref:NAD dependent epimerase/dehydratase n=1 Tax=Colletotrichum tofieldiae TaxID=708197 RepID=A0A166SLZ3_9PEZI|nr:NAD dependent epimerase/dehydratase [Colletotrichum tofieldiae]GKT66922.1 NAD dependent epimerase/dehydratase [Colletotrichum tofieldiae]GKT80465.1 NAD dependent epimerase/dehydratase [Colletotrichum tofieldiae]GKT94826.1 NAD dependent epimerase/dehydratase family protein [Colletotrichum tofieldiae]